MISPGGLLSSINLKDIRENKGAHQSRNSQVAKVLRELGYMRELGEGIRRIFTLMKSSDLTPPEFFSDTNKFVITLHHKSIYSKEEKLWLDNFSEFNLSREEKAIVRLGMDGHIISPNEIWEAVGITDTERYRQLLDALQGKGILYSKIPSARASFAAKNKHITRKAVPRFVINTPSKRETPPKTKEQNETKGVVADNYDYEKIFVGNVPYGCKQNELENIFSQFGEIVNVNIPINSVTGFQRGFAFIEFAHKNDAIKALNYPKVITCGGRILYISDPEFK
jgi:ATP-dependent DNA helicase RecG